MDPAVGHQRNLVVNALSDRQQCNVSRSTVVTCSGQRRLIQSYAITEMLKYIKDRAFWKSVVLDIARRQNDNDIHPYTV